MLDEAGELGACCPPGARGRCGGGGDCEWPWPDRLSEKLCDSTPRKALEVSDS